MVDKLVIWTEMKQMDGMKASFTCIYPVCPRVFNWDAMLVIFPLDFKINGHIVDDVRFFLFFLNVESFSVLSHRHLTANTWHNGNSFPCHRSFNFCTRLIRLIPASGQTITTQMPAYGRLPLSLSEIAFFFYPSKTDDWHCFIYRDSLM